LVHDAIRLFTYTSTLVDICSPNKLKFSPFCVISRSSQSRVCGHTTWRFIRCHYSLLFLDFVAVRVNGL
jgi:hypothetical protein